VFVLYWFVKHTTKPTVLSLPPSTVVIQRPSLTPMTEYVTQTGTIVAFNSVNLVARVQGYLQAIEFVDGTFIKKDKELFTIEPQPYFEQLKEAQATLMAQKAGYAYAKAEYDRQQRMYKQNATSLNNVEKWSAKTIQAQAAIDKATANVAVSEINYSYTHVLAPFDGRIGRHLIDVGNLVGNGAATDLATIEQVDKVYVYFNLNELDLIRIRTAIHKNELNPGNINEIPVYVKMQNENGFSHEGKLNFVNTGLNASTGTMEFRALLDNKSYVLLPGLFVQVRVPLGAAKKQLTVPDTAVQYDQVGAYLLLVDKNNMVKLQRVELGALEQGLRAIVKGLTGTDSVIVSGLQNATPDNKVTPVLNEKKSV